MHYKVYTETLDQVWKKEERSLFFAGSKTADDVIDHAKIRFSPLSCIISIMTRSLTVSICHQSLSQCQHACCAKGKSGRLFRVLRFGFWDRMSKLFNSICQSERVRILGWISDRGIRCDSSRSLIYLISSLGCQILWLHFPDTSVIPPANDFSHHIFICQNSSVIFVWTTEDWF